MWNEMFFWEHNARQNFCYFPWNYPLRIKNFLYPFIWKYEMKTRLLLQIRLTYWNPIKLYSLQKSYTHMHHTMQCTTFELYNYFTGILVMLIIRNSFSIYMRFLNYYILSIYFRTKTYCKTYSKKNENLLMTLQKL